MALVEAGDKDSVPVLVELLTELPADQTWEPEEDLFRLAGGKAPAATLATDAEARRRYRDAWADWWQKHGGELDPIKLSEAGRWRGFTLVSEMKGNFSSTFRLLGLGADGKPRWEIDPAGGVGDAQMVGDDRVLYVVPNGGHLVERDVAGKVLWFHEVKDEPAPGIPHSVQRLPNGITFFADSYRLVEVDRGGKERVIYRVGRVDSNPIMFARRLRDGRIGVLTSDGKFHLLDAKGDELKSFKVGRLDDFGGVGKIDVLPEIG